MMSNRHTKIKLFIALIIGSVFLASCDDNNGSSSAVNTARVDIIHDTENGLPENITMFRFTAFDENGEIVFGPFEEERAALIPLKGVPVETAFMLTEYFTEESELAREMVAGSMVPVDLEPGDSFKCTMIDDPTAPVHFAMPGNKFALMVVRNPISETVQMVTEVSNIAGPQSNIAEPMFIKGVGFDYTLTTDFDSASGKWFSYVDPDAAKVNANSIRTYGVGWNFADPQAQADLISTMLKFASDKSTPNNFITVLAGFVYDPSQGDMNSLITQTVSILYNDTNFDHLLAWVVGNEVSDSQWSGLNDVILAVKATASKSNLKRPVMTALPTVSEGFVSNINNELSAIDWLGINTFYGEYDSTHIFTGFLDMQADNLANGGWDKPWAITEYYSYDLPAAPFGNFPGMPNQILNGQRYFLELNSTLNADNFTKSYMDFIASADAKSKGSVGGYVLNWGPPHNSKLVAFWKEVYTYDGQFKAFVNPPWTGGQSFNRLEAADSVASMYGGSIGTPVPQIALPSDGDRQGIGCPDNHNGATCPFWATLETNPPKVTPGQSLTAQIKATSDAQKLTFNWYLIGGTSTGGNGFSGDILGQQNNPQDFISTTTGGNACPTNNEAACGPGNMPINGQLNVCSGGDSDGQACQTSNDCSGGGMCGVTSTQGGNTWTSVVKFIAPTGAPSGNNYQLRVVILDGLGGAATAAIGFPMQ